MTSVHNPDDVRIFHKECASLVRAGYEVHLISKTDFQGDDKGVRHHSFSFQTKSRMRRFLKSPQKILEVARSIKADLYHFHDPELMMIGSELAREGNNVIYDVHEDLPKQLLTKPWIPKVFRGLVSRSIKTLENRNARSISNIICATESIAKRFRAKGCNVQVVNNFPFVNEFSSDPLRSERANHFCYVGGITRIRGLVPLVKAMAKVDSKLILAGPVQERGLLEELKGLAGWNKVDYKGVVPRQEVKEILNDAIAGIVTFLPVPNHIDAQPNKMFEYMSSGIPVIGSHFDLWREIIEHGPSGICVDPESSNEIANAMNNLLEDQALREMMGRNGRKAIVNKFNWEAESKHMTDFYNRILE